MIDLLVDRINSKKTVEQNLNEVREALQIIILKILHDRSFFRHTAFVGGTALRILYDMKRFSEDLDFSLISPQRYNFRSFIQELKYDLEKYGFEVEGEPKVTRTVEQCMLRFRGLLQKLNLSKLRDQKLFIRFEVDSNPPKGGQTETSLVNHLLTFSIVHFDLPSLFATKLHACFFRKYTKGRDFYDLFWYLGRNVKPNFGLLNRAIEQTEKKRFKIGEKNFVDFTERELEKIDFAHVRRDVERFLVDKTELAYLKKEYLIGMLTRNFSR